MADCTTLITETGDLIFLTEDSASEMVTEDSVCTGTPTVLFDHVFSLRPMQGQLQPTKWS